MFVLYVEGSSDLRALALGSGSLMSANKARRQILLVYIHTRGCFSVICLCYRNSTKMVRYICVSFRDSYLIVFFPKFNATKVRRFRIWFGLYSLFTRVNFISSSYVQNEEFSNLSYLRKVLMFSSIYYIKRATYRIS